MPDAVAHSTPPTTVGKSLQLRRVWKTTEPRNAAKGLKMQTETTYRLLSLTRKGEMYSCGDEAATPELARLGLGSLAMRLDEPIVVEQCRWTLSADGHRSLVARVLFERVDLVAIGGAA